MNTNFNTCYKLKDSVEVYIQKNENRVGEFYIQFYRINTREKVLIESHALMLEVLPLLDGLHSLDSISQKLSIEMNSLHQFIHFLKTQNLIIDASMQTEINERFSRQIAFFDDLNISLSGEDCQKALESKKIVIFGAGSVGSSIAILLARMGIQNFVLIDYKRLKRSNATKHFYTHKNNLNAYKTLALKEYLLEIDTRLNIKTFEDKIIPSSDLSLYINDNTDLVINTMDEPYIGHLSLKIGRFCYPKNIAMFVGGGFNAHSMSTGEIIIPKVTPCIDCYVNDFKERLKDYHPTYITISHNTPSNKESENDVILGGCGSISACSLFSASYASLCIVYFLLGVDFPKTKRGEYLINQGEFFWIELKKHKECKVCG
ncbi:ThiF family adenylyltransferase [Helicobacter cetorum]|uniref:UBA/THIF-type NAD/FAD binding protein n=1 Tax=Helicobacter cetorum (strain ATCC BAA-429 / MIT 00-7128) TaxID=182217 RepID=I0EPC6_HELC0|nr:ThiF family adenylyltransferase [Helicobacter cetorum]AFI04795.1 UBA/THIF-type NAD/FAD binding protein [Helicobacter cetorum MIT 00-7128]